MAGFQQTTNLGEGDVEDRRLYNQRGRIRELAKPEESDNLKLNSRRPKCEWMVVILRKVKGAW